MLEKITSSCQTFHFFREPEEFSEGEGLQMSFLTSEVVVNWVTDEIHYPSNFLLPQMITRIK